MPAVQTTIRSIDFAMPFRLNVVVGGRGYVDVQLYTFADTLSTPPAHLFFMNPPDGGLDFSLYPVIQCPAGAPLKT